LVWLGRLLGHRTVDRVYGPDLMLSVMRRHRRHRSCPFPLWRRLRGGRNAGRAAPGAFPGLRIVGTATPPFRPLTAGEEAGLVAQVAAARPDIFWVGLGLPERERFMAAMLPRFEPMVMLGVGAAFDLISGRVRQAPR